MSILRDRMMRMRPRFDRDRVRTIMPVMPPGPRRPLPLPMVPPPGLPPQPPSIQQLRPPTRIPLEDFGFGPGIRRSEDFFRPEDLMMPPAPMVQPEPTPVMAPTVPFVQPNIPLINPAILPSPVNTIPRMPIMSPQIRMAEG